VRQKLSTATRREGANKNSVMLSKDRKIVFLLLFLGGAASKNRFGCVQAAHNVMFSRKASRTSIKSRVIAG
jgi:hypothetical protein